MPFSGLHLVKRENISADSDWVDALVMLVASGFGSYLAEEGDMQELKRGIESRLRDAAILAKVKTTNTDAPDFLVRPRAASTDERG
jgi:hypothetical protein